MEFVRFLDAATNYLLILLLVILEAIQILIVYILAKRDIIFREAR